MSLFFLDDNIKKSRVLASGLYISNSTSLSNIFLKDNNDTPSIKVPSDKMYTKYTASLNLLDISTSTQSTLSTLPISSYKVICDTANQIAIIYYVNSNTNYFIKMTLSPNISTKTIKSFAQDVKGYQSSYCLSSDNYLYISNIVYGVTSKYALKIRKYDLDGNLISEFTSSSFMSRNSYSTIEIIGDGYGNVYASVTNTRTGDNDIVVTYNYQKDQFEEVILNTNTGPNYLKINCKVPGGVMWFKKGDGDFGSVKNFYPCMDFSNYEQLSTPTRMSPTVDYDGNIIILDSTSRMLVKYDLEGNIVYQGTTKLGTTGFPSFTLLPNGDIYISYTTSCYILKYNTNELVTLPNSTGFTTIENWNIGTHPEYFNLD